MREHEYTYLNAVNEFQEFHLPHTNKCLNVMRTSITYITYIHTYKHTYMYMNNNALTFFAVSRSILYNINKALGKYKTGPSSENYNYIILNSYSTYVRMQVECSI